MKYATVVLLCLISTNGNAYDAAVLDVSKKQPNKTMVENIQKIKPVSKDSFSCQPVCKPGKFSKRK